MRFAGICTTLLLVLALARPALADRALVVGIDDYPQLPDSRLLGCANDARTMAKVLQSDGFRVTTLIGRAASRQRIVQALKDLAKQSAAGEKFVFYFAGHGSGPKPAVLLTANSLKTALDNDLPADELYRLVAGVPASTRTVLLDACFSGAMLPSARSLHRTRPGLRSRYYARSLPGGGERDLQLVGAADTNDHLLQGTGAQAEVCYFVASRRNEIAQEDEFNGQHHGVFTWFLASLLKPGVSWSDLQGKVTSHVVEHLDDQQHPTLSPGFGPSAVFEPAGGKPAGALAGTLWEVLNRDRVEGGKVRLSMAPDRAALRVGEEVRFEARAGADGYLVIVEHGVSGRVHLLFPAAGTVDASYVQPGQIVAIPDASQAFAPDAPGKERVRALLFTSRGAADQLIRALRGESPSGEGFGEIVARLKGRSIGGGLDWRPYTSDLIFQVE